ncbi:hypothetical protein B7486_38220 [cyanobacterium TDX16]|nr:hypothetical protein B7486_38220 [cyanobacterium TDX16]
MAGNTIEISQKGAKIRLASFPHNYPLDTVSHFVNNGKTYKTYSAYKLAIRNRSWISANTKNLRLITDAEFAGL